VDGLEESSPGTEGKPGYRGKDLTQSEMIVVDSKRPDPDICDRRGLMVENWCRAGEREILTPGLAC